ncbi:MAG: hypothetical protein AVDCRST_MAG05-854 [uncultured Rubrobacteraceae bacterium]|uniref:Uncharacterized protein n=1 Tax=uncultured Rubrobacteraceae bacterium TaxID=349277 RepID=A0A6J4RTN3_9ACTN|nr:MAG: hypothetical protein AVDCRST_MAG05-854 [uncultured Rubrobacteraceae bacterium]
MLLLSATSSPLFEASGIGLQLFGLTPVVPTKTTANSNFFVGRFSCLRSPMSKA